jgi:holliday junction DNA helicase RuvA
VISQVTGRVAARTPDGVVIELGGLGLEIATTRSADHAAATGSVVTLATHLHVREDALQLYGFADSDERDAFRLLLGVSGIGPKLALAVVSVLAPDQLARAVATQDIARLASVPGVGRKTAQRICIDLKDRFDASSAPATVAGRSDAVAAGADLDDPHIVAREALVTLGFSISDAESALAGVDGDPDTRVRQALGRMRRVPA